MASIGRRILVALSGGAAQRDPQHNEFRYKFASKPANSDDHCALFLVGAHDGSKTQELVRSAARSGLVVLIEPVPWLFAKLSERYADLPSVQVVHGCVTNEPGPTARFFAVRQEANKLQFYADQLGSMRSDHARGHDPALCEYIEEIDVPAHTFGELIARFSIASLDFLVTDTEGMDAAILQHFPFEILSPRCVQFEHKHSDGMCHLGAEFASLIVRLEQFGYRTQVVSLADCRARLD
jgi:FkbM family methyltransferase